MTDINEGTSPMREVTLCRDCQHWHWHWSGLNLDDYDRSRPPEGGWADGTCTVLRGKPSISCSGGWADGTCTVLRGKPSISCSGGWDGCIVDSVETDANFWCAFGKPRIEILGNND